jgi:hypothetical protein
MAQEGSIMSLPSRASGRNHSPIIVYPFNEWVKLRGISVATGRRIIADGRVKVTRLSARRIGIRSDHDQEYLDSCIEGGE